MKKYVNISKLCKILNLINPKTKKPLTHTVRYWENEFKRIKPKRINNQRYYSENDIEILKKIKGLIKDQKISIEGVKKILNTDTKKLDVDDTYGLLSDYSKINLKNKIKNIKNKINNLRKYGKKNSP